MDSAVCFVLQTHREYCVYLQKMAKAGVGWEEYLDEYTVNWRKHNLSKIGKVSVTPWIISLLCFFENDFQYRYYFLLIDNQREHIHQP